MPGTTVGVYAGQLTAGTEVSSTYEGRHVTVLETELIHPFRASGFVNKGDPVIICNAAVVANRGNAVGVALSTATALTDYIAIDTEGIWNLPFFAYDDTGGGSAIVAGDPLYIHDGSTGGVGALGTGDATISKRRNNTTQIPFGYALGTATATSTGQMAIKVHWDPIAHWLLDTEPLFFGDGQEVNLAFKPATMCGSTAEILELDCLAVPELSSALQIKAVAVAGTQDVGIAAYFDSLAVGVMTGNWVYGFGAWLNLDTTFDAPAGTYAIVAQSNGVYAAAVVDYATADVIYGLKAEAILTAQPEDLYAISLNSSAQGSVNTAIFYSANCETVGWVAGHLAGVAAGHLALAVVNGSGVATEMFVNLWSA